ncbi:FCD domain-containing protein [Microvirga zambiensis]|uniref:FCD domain-containing protein n=1 Tax=Microvirga zambiensis TaxID=1402137 RepID=UPI001FEC997C|nr:FCD domain-containing protein [Microvirga zambiensis]
MIDELYFMRQELEGTAAWLAARNASMAEVRLMRLIVDEEAELLDSPSLLGRLTIPCIRQSRAPRRTVIL